MLRPFLVFGALFGFLAVLAGAFGAHALRDQLAAPLLDAYRTGALYHLIHSLALVGLGLGGAVLPKRPAHVAGICFCAGVVLFSGSLYALALTGQTALGLITPFGGVCFLTGWAALCWAGLKAK